MSKKSERYIKIYDGRGSSAGNLVPALKDSFQGAVVKRAKACNLDLDYKTLAFVLPGIVGEESPYLSELGKQGNQEIRDYIEGGGVFIGVCAGAYYACSDIVYDPPWRAMPKTSRPGLNLFNALAKGPPAGLGRESGRARYSDCHIVNVSYTNKNGKQQTTGIAYGNGPALFPSDDENIEVIARYHDVKDEPIAIAVKPYGKGLAIFVGVLPDMGAINIDRPERFEHLHQLSEDLRPHEDGRQVVWNIIVDRIKSHNIKLGRATPVLVNKPL